MRHRTALNEFRAWNLCVQFTSLPTGNAFYIASAQNLLLLLLFTPPSTGSSSDSFELQQLLPKPLLWVAFYLLGALQLVSCAVNLAIAIMHFGPIELQRGGLWPTTSRGDSVPITKTTWSDVVHAIGSPSARLLHVLVGRFQVYAPLLLALAALLGLLVSPLWYSLHLLTILARSSKLEYALRSVTTQGSSIMMTVAFGFIIVYIYAVAGFGLLPRSSWVDEAPYLPRHLAELGSEADPATTEHCSSLLLCWLEVLNLGVRAGDIGALMREPDSTVDGWKDYLVIMFYQLSFYCVVITLMVAIILGIIVDTFSKLNYEEREKRHNMNSECFICGVTRAAVDEHGGNFEDHIRNQHNMWSYIFMMVHLRQKEPQEYNGWEAYVKRKVDKQDDSFLPTPPATGGREVESNTVSSKETLSEERIAAMEASLIGAIHSVSMLVERSDRTEKLLETLTRDAPASNASSSRGSSQSGQTSNRTGGLFMGSGRKGRKYSSPSQERK